MHNKLIITLFAFVVFVFVSYAEDIVVEVATESKLKPLYLPAISNEASTLSSDYVKKLEDILRFDFRYNGRTYVVSLDMQLQLKKESMSGTFEDEEWKKRGIKYILKPFIKDSKLSVDLFIADKKSWRERVECSISGNLNSDRKNIHKLSDSICKAFFGVSGIASTRILYTVRDKNNSSDSSKWKSEVWECDYDGGNPGQITHDGNYCVMPSYFPAKPGFLTSSFFYVSYKLGQPKIFISSLRDSSSQRFSYLSGNQFMPVLSPQCDKVAFICDASGREDLFLSDFDPKLGSKGKPRQIFSAYRATQASPTFSPDGKKIAFVSSKDGSPRIYVMNTPSLSGPVKAKKPKLTLITKKNRENTCPSWSPDGRYMAYSAKVKGTRQIWIYDLQTKTERPLTSGPSNKENPTWAMDSLHVIFNTADSSSCELFLANVNQAEIVKITDGKGEKRFPSWEHRIY